MKIDQFSQMRYPITKKISIFIAAPIINIREEDDVVSVPFSETVTEPVIEFLL